MDRSGIVPDRLYPPGEVASVFRVDPKTVTRWVKAGKFRRGEFIRTPGHHCRVYGHGIIRALNEGVDAA